MTTPARAPEQNGADPRRAPICDRCACRHNPALRCWSGRYAAAVRVLVLATYGDRCCHCHRPGADSAEHVQPRSRWGSDQLANMRPAHLRCNQSRGTRPMPGWTDRPTSSRRW